MSLIKLNTGVCSSAGVLPHNHDAYALWPRDSVALTPHFSAVLADGVGQSRKVADAAQAAVKLALQCCTQMPTTEAPRAQLQKVFDICNDWLRGALKKTYTTMTIAQIQGQRLWLAHVGDSRVYRWRDGQLNCLTVDHHSVSAEMGSGLTRALGLSATISPDIACFELARHDRYAILTDGVYEHLSRQQLQALLAQSGDADSTAKQLVAQALLHSHDNASAIVFDVLELGAATTLDGVDVLRHLPLAPALNAGDVIDDYVIEALISQTRLHRIYRARDNVNQQTVAIKMTLPLAQDDARARAGLCHEITIAQPLRHPQLITALPPRRERQTCLYAVYPFIAGQTLVSHDIRRYGLRQLLRFGSELAELLHYLHQQQIVHADIKPDNILRGDDGHLYLIDFSIARTADVVSGDELSGTPNFIAPELWRGGAATAASDQFALAVALYSLATAGVAPYGDIEMFSQPSFKHYRPLREHRPDLPLWFDICLARALQGEPAQRYRDCQALADALRDGHRHGLGLEAPLRPPSWLEKDPLRFFQTLSVLLALLCAFLLWLHLH